MLLHLRESVSIRLVCLLCESLCLIRLSLLTHTHHLASLMLLVPCLDQPIAWLGHFRHIVKHCAICPPYSFGTLHTQQEREEDSNSLPTHMHNHMTPRMLLDANSRLANQMPCAKEASVWALWHVSLWLLERGRLVSQVIPYRELEFPKRRERKLASLFRLVKMVASQ